MQQQTYIINISNLLDDSSKQKQYNKQKNKSRNKHLTLHKVEKITDNLIHKIYI